MPVAGSASTPVNQSVRVTLYLPKGGVIYGRAIAS